ncbi:MAG TPA: nucleotidyltransferase family protein [Pseudonocardiaceae bacterium]|nr:nucleotidyltransferase family protein [Pseudonocardiaceae bacterium]
MGRRLCDEAEYPASLLAVAGYRLPGAGRRFPAEPLDELAWARVLAAAEDYRVTGLLQAAVCDGALPATAAQARQARAVHRGVLMRVMALERALIGVVELLAGAGIESRVLKGAAVAHLDYADPALRSYVDIDVLVRAEDVDRAVPVLSAAGFCRTLAQPRPGFDRRFDKGMTLIPPAGYELDLHRTLVLGPWGRLVDLDRLWDGGQRFHLAGHPLRALSPLNRFLHACYHAALGNWPLRLGSLRDIAEMLSRTAVSADSIRRLAADWRVEAIVAAAVADSGRLLGITPPAERSCWAQLSSWAQRYVPTRREESWLALHTHTGKTFSAQALATLPMLRWRDKAAYVRALALPDAGYLAARHASALGRFRYAVREARRGRRARP